MIIAVELAETQAIVAVQASNDVTEATNLVAKYMKDADGRVQAAKEAANFALSQMQTELDAAIQASQTAKAAVEAASVAAIDLAAQIADLAVYPAVDACKQSLLGASGVISEVTNLLVPAVAAWAGLIAEVGVSVVVGVIGSIVGEVMQLFAGGDIILPNTPPSICVENPNPPSGILTRDQVVQNGYCYRDGDATGRPTGQWIDDPDPRHDSAFISRGVPTHEYGHFVLCNLLYTQTDSFINAYSEAAVDSLFGQDASKEHVVLNEAFADFFAGQVAGGVNYFVPGDAIVLNDVAISDRDWSISMCPSSPSYGPYDSCLERNMSSTSNFEDAVGRSATSEGALTFLKSDATGPYSFTLIKQ